MLLLLCWLLLAGVVVVVGVVVAEVFYYCEFGAIVLRAAARVVLPAAACGRQTCHVQCSFSRVNFGHEC